MTNLTYWVVKEMTSGLYLNAYHLSKRPRIFHLFDHANKAARQAATKMRRRDVRRRKGETWEDFAARGFVLKCEFKVVPMTLQEIV